MNKIARLNNYHRINNFPKKISIFKRILSQIIFFILVTRITIRKNHLEEEDYLSAKESIKIGDLILVGGFRTVSGLFLGRFFTHSLLYAGNGECIHADTDGVDDISFKELFSAYDNLIVLRPKITDNHEKTVNETIAFARQQIGKPYDFYLEHRRDRFFCTNLIIAAFEHAGFDTGVGIKDKVRQNFLWIFWRIRKVTRADDFLKGNFEAVFISKSLQEKNQEIARLRASKKL